MKPSISESKPFLSSIQIALTVVTALLTIAVGVMIFGAYLNAVAISTAFETSYMVGDLLPDIERAILRLHIETLNIINKQPLNLTSLKLERALVSTQIGQAKAEASGNERLTTGLNELEKRLDEYDQIISQLQNISTEEELAKIKAMLNESFKRIDSHTEVFYNKEVSILLDNLQNVEKNQQTFQAILLGTSGIWLLFALILIFSLRRSVSSEFEHAYHLLEKEVGEHREKDKELRQQNEYLAALHETTLGIMNRLDLTDLLESFLNRAASTMNTPHSYVALVDPNEKVLRTKVGMGIFSRHLNKSISIGCGVLGKVWQTGEVIVVEDYKNYANRIADSDFDQITGLIGLPLQSATHFFGVFGLAHTEEKKTLTTAEIDLLTKFARLISIALDNVELYSAVQKELIERKQTQIELEKEKEKALAANRAKSAFLANMSHELRTPLNAILGFTQLMIRDSKESVSSKQEEKLKIISRSGEHLLGLINEILEMSKIEAGQMILYEDHFDLHELLNHLKEIFDLRAKEKQLHIIFQINPYSPQYIYADQRKLRQILMNLLSNAVKFTDKGGVALRVKANHENTQLFFEIEDTGPGIPHEQLEALFEPFVQTEIGLQSQGGTGLGLPISRQFVALMGGELTVSSQLNKGSLFKFHIPIQLADVTEIVRPQPLRRVITVESGQQTYRILIIEDDPFNRRLLCQMLEPLGFEIREACDGQEGVQIWEEWQPHLIWMDMRMPVMDGYQATQHIKSTLKGQTTIIIALTASVFEEERGLILSAGCNDFMRKPFREEEIFEKLVEHLGVRFIYDDQQKQMTNDDANLPEKQLLTSEIIRILPSALVSDLEQATIRANFERIFSLIEQLREYDKRLAALANRLENWADDFEYDKILGLIHQITNFDLSKHTDHQL